MFTIAISSSKLLEEDKPHLPSGWQLKPISSVLYIFCSLTLKFLKNTLFYPMKHLWPPSPKRPVAETASTKCPRPFQISGLSVSSVDWTRFHFKTIAHWFPFLSLLSRVVTFLEFVQYAGMTTCSFMCINYIISLQKCLLMLVLTTISDFMKYMNENLSSNDQRVSVIFEKRFAFRFLSALKFYQCRIWKEGLLKQYW